MRWISSSRSSLVSPSEHTRSRSPSSTGRSQKSASASSPVPSARVTTCRRGCTSASSGVISPASMSSRTSEWSTLICVRPPLRLSL